VPVRHVALAAGAVLVLGLGVYLFLEVRSRPAAAQVATGRAAPPRDPERPAAPSPTEAGGGRLAGSPRAAEEPAPAGPAADGAAERPGPTSRAAVMSGFRERPRPEGTPPDKQPHKLDEVMDEANKAYDRGELDEAKAIAQRVLATSPNNVRMLRIVVTASCIAGDTADAQKAYLLLPKFDRGQMKTRCERYGVTFEDR
jgi:hypothetical protein